MNSVVQDIIRHKRNLEARWLYWRHHQLDRFFFIHINKTAGTSIQRVLNIPFDHDTALEKIEIFGQSEWDKRYTFSVVRNPWDKVVSSYHYRVETRQGILGEGNTDFKTWVRFAFREQDPLYRTNHKKMFMPQYEWLSDESGKLLVDCICRFENLTKDFEPVARKIRRKAVLPHLKPSARTHYRDYYDEETKNIVARSFEIDIDYFKYTF